MSYVVKLDTFEGPLDLLLYLIRKEEMDVQNIEIAKITEQYLEFINTMRTLDVDLASEFIVMAATLIYIKSKMLLPKTQEEMSEEEGQDPREELIRRLMEYQQFKMAAEELDKKPLLNEDLFKVHLFAEPIEQDFNPKEGLIEVGVYELALAFQDILIKSQKKFHVIDTEEYSIEAKILEMVSYLEQKMNEQVDFKDFFQGSGAPSRKEIVITFLAILELTRLGYIKLFQSGFEKGIYVKAIQEFKDIRLMNKELLKNIFLEKEDGKSTAHH